MLSRDLFANLLVNFVVRDAESGTVPVFGVNRHNREFIFGRDVPLTYNRNTKGVK